MAAPLTAGDACVRTVTIAEPAMSVTDAARLMRQHHVGCLVVVQHAPFGRLPVGMLTDRDRDRGAGGGRENTARGRSHEQPPRLRA